jgi:hypothetical protein
MDRERVRLQLRESSRAAWEAFVGASQRFDEVKRAVPQGVPLPDDARIAASREYTRALQAHREAGKLAYEFAIGNAVGR